MQFQQIRSATSIVTFAGKRLGRERCPAQGIAVQKVQLQGKNLLIPAGAKSPQPAQNVVGREGEHGYRLRLRRYAVRIPLPDTAGRGRKHMFVQRHLSITPFLHVLANASLRRA